MLLLVGYLIHLITHKIIRVRIHSKETVKKEEERKQYRKISKGKKSE